MEWPKVAAAREKLRERRRATQGNARRLTRRVARLVLQSAIRRWATTTANAKQREELTVKMRRRFAMLKKAAATRAWREKTAATAAARAILTRLAARVSATRRSRAFREWEAIAKETRRLTVARWRVSARRARRATTAALNAWRAFSKRAGERNEHARALAEVSTRHILAAAIAERTAVEVEAAAQVEKLRMESKHASEIATLTRKLAAAEERSVVVVDDDGEKDAEIENLRRALGDQKASFGDALEFLERAHAKLVVDEERARRTADEQLVSVARKLEIATARADAAEAGASERARELSEAQRALAEQTTRATATLDEMERAKVKLDSDEELSKGLTDVAAEASATRAALGVSERKLAAAMSSAAAAAARDSAKDSEIALLKRALEETTSLLVEAEVALSAAGMGSPESARTTPPPNPLPSTIRELRSTQKQGGSARKKAAWRGPGARMFDAPKTPAPVAAAARRPPAARATPPSAAAARGGAFGTPATSARAPPARTFDRGEDEGVHVTVEEPQEDDRNWQDASEDDDDDEDARPTPLATARAAAPRRRGNDINEHLAVKLAAMEAANLAVRQASVDDTLTPSPYVSAREHAETSMRWRASPYASQSAYGRARPGARVAKSQPGLEGSRRPSPNSVFDVLDVFPSPDGYDDPVDVGTPDLFGESRGVVNVRTPDGEYRSLRTHLVSTRSRWGTGR